MSSDGFRAAWSGDRARSAIARSLRIPGLPNMKDVLNARIKHREWFRPFAPSILADYQHEYFEHDHPSPFMLHVYKIRPEKREGVMRGESCGRYRAPANGDSRRKSAVLRSDLGVSSQDRDSR